MLEYGNQFRAMERQAAQEIPTLKQDLTALVNEGKVIPHDEMWYKFTDRINMLHGLVIDLNDRYNDND